MAFLISVVLMFGLIRQPEQPAEPQTPAQHSGIRVYVETPWTLLPDRDAARQLRRGLGETFVIAGSRSSADVEVLVSLFCTPSAKWRPGTCLFHPYEIAATLRGPGFLAMARVGGDSWHDCATNLARRIGQLLPSAGTSTGRDGLSL